MNRLAEETSPYLLQHADNPVDWYPWGDEALTRARDEDRPILLSIGYAACHWCHVMEHESFEDAETAELMNELFVCVKVDREERPDVDAVYMNAVVALTGQGGWPLTAFLTPEGEPLALAEILARMEREGRIVARCRLPASTTHGTFFAPLAVEIGVRALIHAGTLPLPTCGATAVRSCLAWGRGKLRASVASETPAHGPSSSRRPRATRARR